MPKLDMTRDALKFVKDLDAKRYKQVVGKIIGLMTDPMPNDSGKLVGSDNRKCDIGEFRIIYSYSMENNTVHVIVVGKRNDDQAYREIKRKS
jgi:mRNA interferase RelE/StbE